MPNKKTSKTVVKVASEQLRSKRTGAKAKTTAASALSRSEPMRKKKK